MHRMPAERSICMETASGYIEKQRDVNKFKEHCYEKEIVFNYNRYRIGRNRMYLIFDKK